jgi:hypothetical protein
MDIIEPTQRDFAVTRRTVALGKLVAFDAEAARLGSLVACGKIDKATVVDVLLEVAVANDLVQYHGAEWIERIIALGFASQPVPEAA